jgi:hypothetical protein
LEGQTTAGFRSPQNADTDGDGWDNEYDSDNGGTAITLSNNDGAGDPDYIDADSDGDGLLDWMEGFDDNNSEDALDDFIERADAFELGLGNPLYYLTFQDTDLDGIPDFLEDDNLNGIPNFADPTSLYFHDTDNDGLIDFVDPDNGGTPSSVPDGDGDGEYDFRDQSNEISLPIELISFDAQKFGNDVLISWSTSTETNNDYFIVERSSDGEIFEVVVRKSGAGNSSTKLSYSDLDREPKSGDNYYRLTQVDFDGQPKTFNHMVRIVSFKVATFQEVKLHPNPNSGDRLLLEMTEPAAGNYKVEILSSSGTLVRQQQFNIESETLYYEREILRGLNLAKGAYYLRLQKDKDVESFKFIVQ